MSDGCVVHDVRPAHEHDWGTLIYGQCAYCPATVGAMLAERERLIEVVRAEQGRHRLAADNPMQRGVCGCALCRMEMS